MATPEQIEKANRLIKEQTELLVKQADAQRALNELKGDYVDQIDHEIRKSEDIIANNQITLDALAKVKELGEGGLDLTIEKLRLEANHNDITEEKRLLLEQQIEDLEKIAEIGEDNLEIYEKQLQSIIEQEKALNKGRNAAKKLGTTVAESAGRVFGVSEAWRDAGVTGAILNAADAGSSLQDSLSQVGKQMAKTFSPTNMLNSAITKVVSETMNLAFAQDQSIANFKKTTGLGPEYQDMMVSVQQEHENLGASTEDARLVMGDLQSQFKSFTLLGEQSRRELFATAVAMKNLGVEASDFASSMDLAISALGMAPGEAEEVSREMVSLAKALGEPPKTMMREFTKSIPKLAHWGRSAIAQFKSLSKAAKVLSLEVSDLISISEGFDTFESAADKVGSLNAVLGGAYFDTVEMVNATEEERIRLLKEGVAASGMSWDALGRYQKKAIAAAAGINDMTEASKMFGGTLSEYDKLVDGLEAGTMSYGDLTEAARENLSVQEQMDAIQRQLAVNMRPVMELILSITDKINWFAKATGDAFPWIVMLGLALTKIVIPMAGFAIKLKAIGAAAATAGAEAGAGGQAAAAGGPGWLMLAGAIAMVAFSFAAIISSIAEIAQHLELISANFGTFAGVVLIVVGVMAALTAGLLFLGNTAMATAPGLLIVAGVVLAVGAAVLMAGIGMAAMMESMSGLVGAGAETIGMMTLLNLAIAAASLAAIGLVFTFGVLVIGIFALGTALAFVNEDKLSSLALLFAGISQIGSSTSTSINNIAKALKNVAEEIDNFDDTKLEKLQEAIKIMAPVITPAAEVTAQATGAATAKTQAAASMYQAAATAQGGAYAVSPAGTATPAAASQSNTRKVFIMNVDQSELDVKITLDNDETGRALMKGFLGRQINPTE